jgi:hypothetical protein
LKRSNYPAYQKLASAAGGTKALKARRSTGKARRSAFKNLLSTLGGKRKGRKASTSRKGRKGRKVSAHASLVKKIMKAKGLPLGKASKIASQMRSGGRMPKGFKGFKQNGLARRNGLAFGGLAFNGLALRQNGLSILNNRGRGFRRNGVVDSVIGGVQGVVGSVPVVGPVAASLVAPLALGAGAAVVHFYGVKAMNAAIDRWAPGVAEYVSPVEYSLAGVVVGALVSAIGPRLGLGTQGSEQIAAAAVTLGAGYDAFRALSNMDGLSSPFDGVASGYSGLGSDAGSDLGATGYGYSTYIAVDYSDALNGDAAYCGDDMDDLEAHCLAGGPEMWCSTFGEPPKVATRRGMYSRHAQRPGHRWGWLIKIVGWEKAKKIAKMSPARRQAMIDKMRAFEWVMEGMSGATANSSNKNRHIPQDSLIESLIKAGESDQVALPTAW